MLNIVGILGMKGVFIMAISRQKVGNNIDYYLRKNGETQVQLAKAINVTKSAVSTWVLGERFPRVDTLNAIADHFGVTLEEILGLNQSVQIPVLGRVHAGQTTYANEEILDYVDVNPLKVSQEEHFGLYVQGDSMLPELHNGDLVIVRRQPSLEDGDLGVFSIGDSETTIKQYQKLKRHIVLHALNESYESWMYTFQEFDELPILILGKVVELRRTF